MVSCSIGARSGDAVHRIVPLASRACEIQSRLQLEWVRDHLLGHPVGDHGRPPYSPMIFTSTRFRLPPSNSP